VLDASTVTSPPPNVGGRNAQALASSWALRTTTGLRSLRGTAATDMATVPPGVPDRDYLDDPHYAHQGVLPGEPPLRGADPERSSLFAANQTFRPAIDALCWVVTPPAAA
jgi:hypothetical protein